MPDTPLLILVPIKPLARAKSRLQSVLTPDRRRDVTTRLLQHVLGQASSAQVPARVVVLAGDREGAALARQAGASVLVESGQWRLDIEGEDVPLAGETPLDERAMVETGLNRVLADALAWADEQGFHAALVLPADLPWLTSEDIEALWARSERNSRPHVLISPDRSGKGTNALLLRPPGLISPSFGRESFGRHVALAKRAGFPVLYYTSPGIAYDVDEPEDWQIWAMDLQGEWT